ncbi:hypothetical protein [Phosphitispora fastidiosa]|uniref:hypothetical protein n=1 Tax=Phosphitispora fastidiosa TaxID=2837202 RepID=UPI001E39E804|nr:hypothetical protein [Phosphitispora fastidiosa]MBU7006550.1 hypothetical protein [Phosphitispora fastidiosa]
MRKSLIVVVALLAVASLMAAMAYNSATVTNAAQLKVVSTNQSLLTLEPNPPWDWIDKVGRKDFTTTIKDGELFFEFGKGVERDGTTARFYGLQPNSEYQWNPLFTMRNKSAETIQVTLEATGEYAEFITFGICGQSNYNNPTWGTQGEPLNIGNVPKESNSGMQNIRNICVKINVPSGHELSPDALLGSIIVKAVAVP